MLIKVCMWAGIVLCALGVFVFIDYYNYSQGVFAIIQKEQSKLLMYRPWPMNRLMYLKLHHSHPLAIEFENFPNHNPIIRGKYSIGFYPAAGIVYIHEY